jgi:hypothetical protein
MQEYMDLFIHNPKECFMNTQEKEQKDIRKNVEKFDRIYKQLREEAVSSRFVHEVRPLMRQRPSKVDQSLSSTE